MDPKVSLEGSITSQHVSSKYSETSTGLDSEMTSHSYSQKSSRTLSHCQPSITRWLCYTTSPAAFAVCDCNKKLEQYVQECIAFVEFVHTSGKPNANEQKQLWQLARVQYVEHRSTKMQAHQSGSVHR